MLSFRVANGKLTRISRRLPKLRDGWALVRVRMAGICNTDVEILRGYHHFRGTPGHEFVGEGAEGRGGLRRDQCFLCRLRVQAGMRILPAGMENALLAANGPGDCWA